MPHSILEQENEVFTDKALTFKVQNIGLNVNYEFTIECPTNGWTMKQASHTAYHIIKNICIGSTVDVYLGEELMYTLERNGHLLLNPITEC